MRSPARPPVQRNVGRPFWVKIAEGLPSGRGDRVLARVDGPLQPVPSLILQRRLVITVEGAGRGGGSGRFGAGVVVVDASSTR